MSSNSDTPALPEEWYSQHFNHFSPELGADPAATLAQMRAGCPVARSDEFGGFWVATKYKDIQRIALDWRTFSSEQGIIVPHIPMDSLKIRAIPEQLDPPLQRVFKDLIAQHLSAEKVAANEAATRVLIDRHIDQFIERGECEFMTEFAEAIPGAVLFDNYLNAPKEDLEELGQLARAASVPMSEEGQAKRLLILDWVRAFIEQRKQGERKADLVDTIIHADINGRPITDDEMLGVIQLLIFGGLDTTAGALGHMMVRFCRQPEIPELLRAKPELIPAAIDELLRLDSPFIFIARTLTEDTEFQGCPMKAGEQVLISWQSANHDEEVFTNPMQFDLERSDKRHMAFGTGPHRCSGANLAAFNLRLSIEHLLQRLDDIRLVDDTIGYHSGFSRAPKAVPIRFTPRR